MLALVRAGRLKVFVFVDARGTRWVWEAEKAIGGFDAASKGVADVAPYFCHEVIVNEGVVT